MENRQYLKISNSFRKLLFLYLIGIILVNLFTNPSKCESSEGFVSLYDNSCSNSEPCYTTVQEGVDSIADGGDLKLTYGAFNEDMRLSTNKSIAISGGWDQSFGSTVFTSAVEKLEIESGNIVVENLVLQQVPEITANLLMDFDPINPYLGCAAFYDFYVELYGTKNTEGTASQIEELHMYSTQEGSNLGVIKVDCQGRPTKIEVSEGTIDYEYISATNEILITITLTDGTIFSETAADNITPTIASESILIPKREATKGKYYYRYEGKITDPWCMKEPASYVDWGELTDVCVKGCPEVYYMWEKPPPFLAGVKHRTFTVYGMSEVLGKKVYKYSVAVTPPAMDYDTWKDLCWFPMTMFQVILSPVDTAIGLVADEILPKYSIYAKISLLLKSLFSKKFLIEIMGFTADPAFICSHDVYLMSTPYGWPYEKRNVYVTGSEHSPQEFDPVKDTVLPDFSLTCVPEVRFTVEPGTSGPAPFTVNLDASESWPPEDAFPSILYKWWSSDDQIATGETASFTFDEPGDYEITLEITNVEGKTNSDSVIVNVFDCELQIVSGNNQNGKKSQEFLEPFVVRVVGPNSEPVEGFLVGFEETIGDGIESGSLMGHLAHDWTDKGGFAKSIWTAGCDEEYEFKVSAKHSDDTHIINSPVYFTATALEKEPLEISITDGGAYNFPATQAHIYGSYSGIFDWTWEYDMRWAINGSEAVIHKEFRDRPPETEIRYDSSFAHAYPDGTFRIIFFGAFEPHNSQWKQTTVNFRFRGACGGWTNWESYLYTDNFW